LGAPESSVYLGERATESKLKTLSASGDLKRARILHFATHGLLAGETEGVVRSRAEPALMLTPPQQASDEDDGLLTASEVAQLKLDADWVVMSACNTAAGERVDAEALSGLARAFFYAGSRALLVSHWYVDSDAAVALTSGAFAQLQANPSLGRAEVLRRSMLALMDKGGRNAHPAYWAPFVVGVRGPRLTRNRALRWLPQPYRQRAGKNRLRRRECEASNRRVPTGAARSGSDSGGLGLQPSVPGFERVR
jgi:CHAT domain-containing protein